VPFRGSRSTRPSSGAPLALVGGLLRLWLYFSAGKIFILDDDEFDLLMFHTLHNLISRRFLAAGFRYPLEICAWPKI
jgi:hypothetical protein